jgi:predicted AAA+ superfamily ATPase
LEQLNKFRDLKEFAKIITGVRRCGKSTLLRQFRDVLISSGIEESRIIYANFESARFSDIIDKESLFRLMSSAGEKDRVYILLDEVQQVNGWELAVASALVDLNADIYITGSNAYLLSSDLSTYLAGRHIEISMFPLSFKEFMTMNGYDEPYSRFNEYLFRGSFPAISGTMDDDTAVMILRGIYSDVVLKDITYRDRINNGALLERVVKYVLMNTGNLVSPGSISKVLNTKNSSTIDSYLSLLVRSFIVYKAERYDLRDKHMLLSQGKYYCVDTGMKNSLAGSSISDTGRLLENVVFLELLRRGYSVTVGKFGDKEIDFTAEKGNSVKHIQVTESLVGEDARARELASFNLLKDHNEKIILSLDRVPEGSFNGIIHRNAVDWLLDDGI